MNDATPKADGVDMIVSAARRVRFSVLTVVTPEMARAFMAGEPVEGGEDVPIEMTDDQVRDYLRTSIPAPVREYLERMGLDAATVEPTDAMKSAVDLSDAPWWYEDAFWRDYEKVRAASLATDQHQHGGKA